MERKIFKDLKGINSPHFLHGECLNGRKSRLYKVWDAMIWRTTNPKSSCYHNYGGRGISVCKEWLDNKEFFKWALNNGYSDKLQIDRIDNDGNYEPSNCRFVTHQVNSLNIRKRKDHGIYLRKERNNRYEISITRHGKLYFGGSTKDLAIARTLRDELEEKLSNIKP